MNTPALEAGASLGKLFALAMHFMAHMVLMASKVGVKYC